MRVTQMWETKEKPTMSFEFFPARTEKSASKLECEVVEMMDTDSGRTVEVGKVVGGDVRKPGEPEKILTLLDLGWS